MSSTEANVPSALETRIDLKTLESTSRSRDFTVQKLDDRASDLLARTANLSAQLERHHCDTTLVLLEQTKILERKLAGNRGRRITKEDQEIIDLLRAAAPKAKT
jgi:hypothetical protein